MGNLKNIFLHAFAAIAALPLAALPSNAEIKVACVGNSITYGYLIENREKYAYPAQLQEMLGADYTVGNFGKSGATLLNHGHRPYTEQAEYKNALAFNPDIAVFHLGVNDTDPRNWPNYSDEFVTDYIALINSFKEQNPDLRVIIAKLTPLGAQHFRFETGTRDWRLLIQKAIENVAQATGAELIDFDTPLRDRQNLFSDGIHPDATGAWVLAETVRQALTGDYGGLQLPEIWQNGMVVQRNRPLLLKGTADAGTKVTVTLDKRTSSAVANNRGEWSLTLPPLVTGPSYSMTVTDGRKTINIDDILAGEVWVASGQSNMEYPLSKKPADDPMLRVFDMRPIARTDNVTWPDSILDYVDDLQYFSETPWGQPDEYFSAVAYHFARALRDSLDVPVGIISNAVGGAPTEAWIDVNTLEAKMPGVLVKWYQNDYVQPWVQQRAKKNMGERWYYGRHPYEPSYLFSAGIRPLEGFPVAGVIWYQGESNAHNTELHERLFPMLTESWRKEFDNDSLPFCFVQLSSLNRSSWPVFRDSQRRLSHSVPKAWMAVTSDVGDSLDVHPRRKKPVGERLARLALNRHYGFSHIEDQGPTPVTATASEGAVTLTMTHADGLTTSDGNPPCVFEIAEIDGLFFPAHAEIINNSIILKNMDIKKPRYIRYAWQPFTRSNVVNGSGLPMSTFKIKADNATDFDIEPGFERGVSAPYFGALGNTLYVAGGCNFPCEDPFAKDAVKVNYKGIYAADTAGLTWQRVGSLPIADAYGASAVTDKGMVMVSPSGAVWLFDGKILSELPSSPVKFDNAAATAIGETVFIAGGNIDGKPSRELYCLNLADGKWKKLKEMPGNPRVQPVMAASNGKLYLWGGFAPRHDGKEPTLETDGLKYDPSTGKWTKLPAPQNPEGIPVSLGGGAAVTLPDGKILAAGGVNKDIFIQALANQAPDYLEHPIGWYRFNGTPLVFDPQTNTWSAEPETPDAARAGAALMVSQGNVFQYGGELKPRVRTASTIKLK